MSPQLQFLFPQPCETAQPLDLLANPFKKYFSENSKNIVGGAVLPSFIEIELISFPSLFDCTLSSQPHSSYDSASAWRGQGAPCCLSLQCISFLSRTLALIAACSGNSDDFQQMDLFKNPAIPVVFSGVGLIQVDCLTQVEIQLIKHLLNIYYLLSLTALQSIEEIKDTFPAIHSCGERGQHREQQEYTTEREHHWARRRHGSGLGSSKSFYPSTPTSEQ